MKASQILGWFTFSSIAIVGLLLASQVESRHLNFAFGIAVACIAEPIARAAEAYAKGLFGEDEEQ